MRFAKWLAIFSLALCLCGCSGIASESVYAAAENPAPLTGSIDFEDDDYDLFCNEDFAAAIKCTGKSAESASGYVEISGNTATITKAGTYIVSGKLEGMLIIHASKEDAVRIVLSDAEIMNPTGAALYVRKAGKVIVTSAEGTVNFLSNGGEYIDIDDNNIDSVIFSKDDLTINGTGKLSVEAAAGHGIVSKDSLRIVNADLDIKSVSHALSAKDDIGIDGGCYTLASGKDGIHAENKDDASLGNVLILGGEYNISSDGDGISAENTLQIDGGSFTVTSGSGYENAAPHSDDFLRFRSAAVPEENTMSSKALKSGGSMYINGGKFDMNASDDALHADTDLFLSDGSMTVLTGDDALHAENRLCIYGGEIDIASCYEGLEGCTIEVYGGKIALVSSDDGMNAAGGNDGSGMGSDFRMDNPFISDPDACIHIAGGEIDISCGGDGIDSNGEIRITGGKTSVSGPVNDANGSIDCGTEACIESGSFIAVGSAQMAEHFSESSAQCSLIISADGSKGSVVSVADTSGKVIYDFTAGCDFQCIIMSLPEFEIGSIYTVSIDDTVIEVSFESSLFSSMNVIGFGSMMNRGGNMPPQGGFPGTFGESGRQPDNGFIPPEGTQMPEGMIPPDDMQTPEGMIPPGDMQPPEGMDFPGNFKPHK